MQRLSNWINSSGAKIYNGIRHGASVGYNAVSNVAHKIGSVADGIDNALTQVRSVPVIGQVAATLQNNPKYEQARALLKSGIGYVDQVGEIGNSIAKPLDNIITSTLFKDNPLITPL